MTAQRNQEAWDALRRERDDLLLAIDRCEETKTALHLNLREARRDRDELAAQVEVMREALEVHEQLYVRGFINAGELIGVTNLKRRAALALPNTAADILRQRDARVLREAAADLVAGKLVGWPFISDALLKMADELERKPLRDMTEADFNEAHGG